MKRNTKVIAGLAALAVLAGIGAMRDGPLNVARADGAAITVNDVAPTVEAKDDRSQRIRTSCFEFVAAAGSQIIGSGCRAEASVNQTKYFSIEMLEADQPTATLESTAQLLLKGMQMSIDKQPGGRAGLDNPGPYDSALVGKYIGQKKIQFQGMPAIELRWDNRANVVPTEKVLVLAALPQGRYLWNGKPQQYLMLSWYDLDSDYARYSKAALASVKLL